MVNVLLAVILLQFVFIVYSDIQNRREREKLRLGAMAKSLTEYKEALDGTPTTTREEEPDPYLTLDEAGVDRVVNAKEK